MTPSPRDDRGALDALGRALDGALADASPQSLAAQRERFLAAAPRARARRVNARVVAATGLAAAACAALALRAARPAGGALVATADGRRVAAGDWVEAHAAPLELRFSDGTRLTLAAGAHARLASVDARGARLLVERGRVDASVHHTAASAWRFSAGPYAVDVTGTAFSVAWDPAARRFDLAMREGRVVLRGPRCAEGLAVRDRDEVHADVGAGTLAVGPTPAPVLAASPVPQELTPFEAPVASAPRAVARRAPARPAMAAHAPVEAPEVAVALAVPTASSALAEADAARLSGRGMRARELLLDVRRDFPGTREATRAAFVLGLLSLDTFSAPAEAARQFELALREAPDGPLANEARGRLVQALHAAHDDAGARDAAARYLERDPGGPFAPFARSMLGP